MVDTRYHLYVSSYSQTRVSKYTYAWYDLSDSLIYYAMELCGLVIESNLDS
jgi:hypothetical protein